MDTTKAKIIARVRRKGPGTVVTPKDFLDLAGRDAVDQALSRLVRQDVLQRIGRGLYHLPRTNRRLGITVPPDPDAVAQAIGRRTGSRVALSSAVVANRLGLSTHVPAKPVYLTDGRSRTVRVGNQTFRMKHVAATRLPDKNDMAGLVIQAIRDAGGSSVDHETIRKLQRQLDPTQRKQLLGRARYAGSRMAEVARSIAGSNA